VPLPASAVFASLVQVLVMLPCRFSVPPESMMPRSPMPITCSPFTLSVRVMVALRVWGLASVPISSSPCTMIHSVASSRSALSEKLSLPMMVRPHLSQLRARLAGFGARPVHVAYLLRLWAQGLPQDARPPAAGGLPAAHAA
jgi:hypothetical protein